MDGKTQRVACPRCGTNKTYKRRKAYGFYCRVCKVAFRDPVKNELQNEGVI